MYNPITHPKKNTPLAPGYGVEPARHTLRRFPVHCLLPLALLLLLSPAMHAQDLRDPHTDPTLQALLKSYEKSIYFTQNKGQWPGHILYKADFPLGQALATREGMLVGTFDPHSLDAYNDQANRREEAQHDGIPFTEKQAELKGHGWLMKFAGASPQMTIAHKDTHGDVFNYFIGDDVSKHATGVSSFNEVWYNNVYPQTDVRYYPSANGSLEYDILCRPGSNPADIALDFEGIDKKFIDFKGNLVLQTSVGNMEIAPPVAYQVIDGREIPVEVAYQINEKGALTFTLGKYDAGQTLVIDPIALIWATWASNNASVEAHGHGIQVDATTKEIYIIGWYNSTGLITVNAFQNTTGGGQDIIIGKYKEPASIGGTGTRIWQTYLGGSGTDNPYALDQGPDGNIYITGVLPATGSTPFPMIGGTAFGVTPSTVDNRTQTGDNIFITKINPAGNSIKSCVVGGNGGENIYDIRISSTGDILVCGTNRSSNLLTLHPGSGASNTLSGSSDVLVFKVAQSLNSVLWIRNYGGSGTEQANIMLNDPTTGNIFVAGTTTSTNFPTLVPRQGSLAGSSAGFVQKLNGNGVRLWSSYFNSASSKTTSILCMEFNATRNRIVFAGLTSGLATSNVSTSGVLQPAYAGGTLDFFVCNMDSNQTFNWGSYLGGNGNEVNMMGLNLDLNNDVYIFGYTEGSFPTAGGPFQSTKPGNRDKTFTKMAANGSSLIYSTYYGTSGTETDPVGERGIKFDDCHIYTLVTSDNNGLPLTQGAITTNKVSANGILEMGIVEWGSPPALTNNTIVGSQVVCSGGTPTGITGTAPAYALPNITRNGVISAHPALGSPGTYQWQRSYDGGTTWLNIPGANGQNLPDSLLGPITGQVHIRRTINGDLCVVSTDNNILVLNVFTVVPAVTPSCIGQNNGFINTSLIGGVAPFSYLWSTGATTPNVTGLAPGNYTVSVTDASGCTATATVAVTEYAEAAVAGSHSFCPGGSTTLTATPTGVGYLWSNGATTQSINVNTAGNYSVTITYAQGCTQTAAAMATQVSGPTITVVETSGNTNDGILCPGGSATLFAGPGPVYTWSTGAITPSITVNTAGTYTVTISGGSCPGSESTTIGVSPNPTPSISGSPLICAAETVTLTATGGATYVWSPGGATTPSIVINTPGTCSVLASNAAGCSASVSQTVTGSNCTPIANPNTASTPEDTPILLPVLGNDTFGGDGPSAGAITVLIPPGNGTATVNTNGTPNNPTNDNITYSPNVQYNGTDSFVYQICDSNGDCDTALVTITISAVNDPPVAINDTTATNTGVPVTIPVTANDYDIDGNIVPGSVTIVTGPTQGTASVHPVTGVVTYTPNGPACGIDSLQYSVCDDGTPMPSLCDMAWVYIYINDAQNPGFVGCPQNITVANDSGSCTAQVFWTVPNATDNCSDSVSAISAYTPGQVFPIGSTTVTYTATDNEGNIGTCSFTVTVLDQETPRISACPADITASTDAQNCTATVSWTAPTAADNCGGTVSITSSHNPGDIFPLGTTTVTYWFTDNAGNIDSCSFDVIVEDNELPVVYGCPTNINVSNDAQNCTSVVSWTPPTAFDNCGGTVTITSSHNPGDIFPLGTTTVTYWFTDNAGNVDSCSFDVIAEDNELPVAFGCPTDIAVSNDAQNCTSVVSWTPPTASDNCGGTVTITSSHNPGDVFALGTTTVTYWFTDNAGNVDSCSFNVIVEDNELPVAFGCPTNVTVSNDPQNCTSVVSWTPPTASDNCGGMVTITSSHNPGDVFALGTTTVTYWFTDNAGNVDSCSFNVIVEDNELPVAFGCPTNVTVSNEPENCTSVVSWTPPTASDNCGGTVTITSLHNPGDVFALGTTTVTYWFTDNAGNVDSCSFNVTVEDNELPIAFGCPTNVTVSNDPQNCTSVVSWTPPTASDNCGGTVAITSSHNPGDVFALGTTTVTYWFTDNAGNIDSCSFDVTVEDNELPMVFGCPTNVTVSNDPQNCTSVVSWTPSTASDNCGGTVAITSSHNPGDVFALGTTTVTYWFTDNAGNIDSCSFDVTVEDNELPIAFACPTSITVSNDTQNCTSVVSWTPPTASDNCGGTVTITSSHNPGDVFVLGTTTVTYWFTDNAGNVDSCSFDVTVEDNELPMVFGCPTNVTVSNDAQNCTSVVSWTPPTASDNCGGTVTITSSHDPSDVFILGTTTVTYWFTDNAGNVDSCSFDVTVNDDETPVIFGCPSDLSLVNIAGTCEAIATWVIPDASDNCSGTLTWNSSHNSGDTFPVGNTTVTYTVTDVAGNSSTCTFTVTVVDTEEPTWVSCPGNITLNADTACQAMAIWDMPSVVDNCPGTVSLTGTHTSGSTFPIGVTPVLFTATDVAGNGHICSFTVTVVDVSQPIISGCPSNISVSNDSNDCAAIVFWDAPTVVENCSIGIWSSNYSGGSNFPIGTTTVNYTATDMAGNTSICSFTVTVTDTQIPVIINCPNDIVLNNTPDMCSVNAHWPIPSFTDNCTGLTYTSTAVPGDLFPAGVNPVIYTVTDASGNTQTCTFTVTVLDVEPPIILNCPTNITAVNDSQSCDAIIPWVVPTATDNCGVVSFTCTHPTNSVFPLGSTTVTYTAMDAAGNITTTSFEVMVNDTEYPVISNCPPDIIVNNDGGACEAYISWTPPTATDNCVGGLVFTASHQPGQTFPIGSTWVTYTAVDAAGNLVTCSFEVTVTETEAPTFVLCPDDVYSCVDTVTWLAPLATDNCGVVSISSNYNPGDVFPVGTTTVVYTAVDAAGNTGTCSFNITVSTPTLALAHANVTCYGYSDGTVNAIVSTALHPLTFIWQPQSGNTPTLSGVSPGAYSVIITDSMGCTVSDSVSVSQPVPFDVQTDATEAPTCGMENGYVTVLSEGGTAPYAYAWSNGQQTEGLYDVPEGTYTLLANDANGCPDTLLVTLVCEFGKIPQLVTPNNDGHNDTWVIPGIEKYPDASVQIFNRWGNQVFEASPYNNDWGGRSTGMLTTGAGKLPSGTYFYIVTLTKDSAPISSYLELDY